MTTVVQAIGGYHNTSVTSQAQSLASLPTAGNTVIVALTVKEETPIHGSILSSITDNQGNTYTRAISQFTDYSSSPESEDIWYCPSIGTPSGTFTVTATFSATSNSIGLSIIESTPLIYVDQTGVVCPTETAASIVVTNMQKDSVSNGLVVTTGAFGGNNGSTGQTVSGYTSITGVATANTSTWYRVNSTVGTDSATYVPTASDTGAVVMASFSSVAPTNPRLVQSIVPALNWVGSDTYTILVYGVAAGNALLAGVAYQDASNNSTTPLSVSDGTSYAQDVWEVTGFAGVGWYSLLNVAAGTHTVVATKATAATSGQVNWGNGIFEVAGLKTSSALDVSGVASGDNTAPLTATIGPLNDAEDFVVGVGAIMNAYNTMSFPFGWEPWWYSSGATGGAQNNPPLGLAAIQPGVTSALSPSFGSPASTKFWAVALAAYLPAGAPPPSATIYQRRRRGRGR